MKRDLSYTNQKNKFFAHSPTKNRKLNATTNEGKISSTNVYRNYTYIKDMALGITFEETTGQDEEV